MSTPSSGNWFRADVREEYGRFMWGGLALALVGVAALIWPMVSTLVTSVFVGWMLVLGGVVSLFGGVSIPGSGRSFAAVLYALLSIAAGAFILARVDAALLVITLALGLLFMVQGAYELALAFELRPARNWIWMLLSAVASILLSLVITSGWPASSLVALGVIMGVNFITSGLAYLSLGLAARTLSSQGDRDAFPQEAARKA